MVLMTAAAVAAIVIWALGLGRLRKGDAKAVAGALGWLKIIRSAGAPLGVLTASYTLLAGFIGLSNVRPTPSISVLAPGWAEATLAVVLGMLATTVGVICERSLEARVRRAAA
jgi:biopolymer transport protein ExbB/TolQ